MKTAQRVMYCSDKQRSLRAIAATPNSREHPDIDEAIRGDLFHFVQVPLSGITTWTGNIFDRVVAIVACCPAINKILLLCVEYAAIVWARLGENDETIVHSI